MNKAERAAKRIVEAVIAGSRMQFRNEQSRGEHDFDLHYADGTIAPMEVTASTDQAWEAMRAAILNRRGPSVPRGECEHDWLVHPLPVANINKIRAHIATYIKAIEKEGLTEFWGATDSWRSPAVAAILRDLQIESGSVMPLKSPAIYIMLPGGGGLVDPRLVNTALEREAHKADNRRKLSNCLSNERHLFVYVMLTEHLVWVALRDEEPPPEPADLPPEITHAWVATWLGEGAWHTVWTARRGESWVCAGRVNLDSVRLGLAEVP